MIDRYAKEGDQKRFVFAEPQIPELDFSFSGLKTSILYFLQKEVRANPGFIGENLPDLCASIQERIITILLKKYKKAALQTGIRELCIAGGVSANSGLRKAFEQMCQENGWNSFVPPFEYCTDNAAMIAITAYYKFREGQSTPLSVSASARAAW